MMSPGAAGATRQHPVRIILSGCSATASRPQGTSNHLDPPTLRRVKAIALRKGVAYSSLIRMWVVESARREAKKA